MSKKKQANTNPRLSKGASYSAAADLRREAPAGRHPFQGQTRTLKSMVEEVEEAGKTEELAHAVYKRGKKGAERDWMNSKAARVMLEDRLTQILGNRVPEHLGVEEFIKQIKSGEAAIQNPRRTRRINKKFFMGARPTHTIKKVQPKSNKKVPEFIMTTVREPELLKKAAKARARSKK